MVAPAPSSVTPRRAAFLAALPSHPHVVELAELFEQGRYDELRKRAKALTSADAAVRHAVDELVARTRPAPLVLWILASSCLLLALVTAFAYGGW